MSDIDLLRARFLTDVDEETKAENLEQIREWERGLRENLAYQQWRDHDITRQVTAEARKTHTELALLLATKRDLTPEERQSVYARQDAMRWLMSLTEKDGAAAAKAIEADIRRALAAS
jgi:hypothetical protein